MSLTHIVAVCVYVQHVYVQDVYVHVFVTKVNVYVFARLNCGITNHCCVSFIIYYYHVLNSCCS